MKTDTLTYHFPAQQIYNRYIAMYKDSRNTSGKISLSVYTIILFLAAAVINTFKFGVSLSGVLLPVLLFFFLVMIQRKRLIFTESHILVLLFWLFAVISSMMSSLVPFERDTITFLVFCIFFILCTSIQYRGSEVRVILRAYILITVLCSLNIIWNFINDYAYGWKRYSLYVLGVYRDPNYVSAFILPAAGLVFNLILFRKMSMSRKMLCLAELLVIITGTLCTGSRSAFFVLGTVLLLTYLNYLTKVKSFTFLLRIVFIFILVMAGWMIIKDILPDYIILRFTNLKRYSGDIRLVLWSTGFQLFTRYPVFGAGLGSLYVYLFGAGLFDSHNLYLDILTGQGLVGISVLALIFIRFIYVKKDRVFTAIFFCSFFAPLFFINGFNTASFWAPMILCEIISNYSRKNNVGILELMCSKT